MINGLETYKYVKKLYVNKKGRIMQRSDNKKFLYPVGARLWAVHSYTDHFTMWRVNADIIHGWVPCYPKHQSEDCGNKCRSGGMRARLRGRMDGLCVCSPKKRDTLYVNESALRELAQSGKLRNSRLRYCHHLPKVWQDVVQNVKKDW